MSKTFVPVLVLTLTMLAYPPATWVVPSGPPPDHVHAGMATDDAPRDAFTAAHPNQAPIPVHQDHPQFGIKPFYASSAEWQMDSPQGHWMPANDQLSMGHTHAFELWSPRFGKLPRAEFTLPCRLQLFRVKGRIGGVFGNLLKSIEWDDPSPIIGDPNGVVIRTCRATFDPTGSYPDPNGGPNQLVVKDNSWFSVSLLAYTAFDNGALSTTQMNSLPLFMQGDPSVPETGEPILSSRIGMYPPFPGGPGTGHGEAIAELYGWLPIAPITAPWTVRGNAWSYASDTIGWQGLPDGVWEVGTNADLHFGVPATVRQRFTFPVHGTLDHRLPVVIDPAHLNPGANRVSLSWCQNSGAGNAAIRPNEELCALIVIQVTKGEVVDPLPPIPAPTPVDCQIAWGAPVMTGTAAGLRPFTVTVQPANGGKSCVTVASGG